MCAHGCCVPLSQLKLSGAGVCAHGCCVPLSQLRLSEQLYCHLCHLWSFQVPVQCSQSPDLILPHIWYCYYHCTALDGLDSLYRSVAQLHRDPACVGQFVLLPKTLG